MGTVEMALLKFVAVEVIKRMAARRGVHGVTTSDIEKLARRPAVVLTVLQADPELADEVMNGLVDAVDGIAGAAIDPVVKLLGRILGVNRSDDS